MNFKKSWKRANDGFTLVELIVVIAILAILAGIAVPAYSGYIKKANEAADHQVLAAVNTAFAAAVLENGEDFNKVTGATAVVSNGSEGVTITGITGVQGVKSADYNTSFKTYMSGSATLKVIGKPYFVPGVGFMKATDAGMVVGSKGNYNLVVSQADRDVLVNSAWITNDALGADNLLAKVDTLANLGSSLSGVFADEDFQMEAAEALGIDTTKEGWLDQLNKAADEISGGDRKEVLGNAAVLYAAQGVTEMEQTKIDSMFANTTETYNNIINGNNRGQAVSEAALMYGMYTVYAAQNGIDISNAGAMDVLAMTSTDANFQKYLNGDSSVNGNAQSDLAAYQAALNMVNDAKEDPDALSSVLKNGFTDDDLSDAIQQILGK